MSAAAWPRTPTSTSSPSSSSLVTSPSVPPPTRSNSTSTTPSRSLFGLFSPIRTSIIARPSRATLFSSRFLELSPSTTLMRLTLSRTPSTRSAALPELRRTAVLTLMPTASSRMPVPSITSREASLRPVSLDTGTDLPTLTMRSTSAALRFPFPPVLLLRTLLLFSRMPMTTSPTLASPMPERSFSPRPPSTCTAGDRTPSSPRSSSSTARTASRSAKDPTSRGSSLTRPTRATRTRVSTCTALR